MAYPSLSISECPSVVFWIHPGMLGCWPWQTAGSVVLFGCFGGLGFKVQGYSYRLAIVAKPLG